MPLISPPPNEPEPEPVVERVNVSQREHDRIQRFLNVPNWLCVVCMATNFGRNKKCAYCFGRNGIHTPRPESYIEPPL